VTVLSEGIRYFKIGYLSQPDLINEMYQKLEKGELYYRWGEQSGERNDFHKAYSYLMEAEDDILSEILLIRKYEKVLLSCVNVLKYELGEIVEVFNFLCNNKLKIELRDINFPKELSSKMNTFMDIEGQFQNNISNLTVALNNLELNGSYKEDRMRILENSEKSHSEVNEGIQAFYARVKEFLEKN
jgi:hypothetical protein